MTLSANVHYHGHMAYETRTTYTTDNDDIVNDVELIVNKIVSMTSRNENFRFNHGCAEGQGELFLSSSSKDALDYVADLIHNVLVYMVDNVETTGRD